MWFGIEYKEKGRRYWQLFSRYASVKERDAALRYFQKKYMMDCKFRSLEEIH